MRIAIISDVSGVTDSSYPGHGLGRAVSHQAQMLQYSNDVTLVAVEGSKVEGVKVVAATKPGQGYAAEVSLAYAVYEMNSAAKFDAIIDNSHTHQYANLFPDAPVLNVYHDIWQPYSRCGVLMSEGQRALMPEWAEPFIVIHHAISEAFDFQWKADKPQYALFMGIVRDYKQPILALQAATLAGIHLKIAGTMIAGSESIFGSTLYGAEFMGAVSGEERAKLLQGAACFLQLGTHESFGLSTLEATACGVPVVAWPSGGTVDIIKHGVNGLYVPFSRNMPRAVADTMARAVKMDRYSVRQSFVRFNNLLKYDEAWNQACIRVARGERW